MKRWLVMAMVFLVSGPAPAAMQKELVTYQDGDVTLKGYVFWEDSFSGARPGARRESLESYVKRLAKLEEIADGFKGVEKSYAIQAGREIRIMVSNTEIDDKGAAELAYNISRKLEKELEYPGQIKVVVIRETRATEFAR